MSKAIGRRCPFCGRQGGLHTTIRQSSGSGQSSSVWHRATTCDYCHTIQLEPASLIIRALAALQLVDVEKSSKVVDNPGKEEE